MQKILNFLFAAAVFLVLVGGLIKTCFFPKQYNFYENRYASALSAPTLGTYRDRSFQENTELSFNDQVFFAQRMKKGYHTATHRVLLSELSMLLNSYPDQYVSFGSISIFGKKNLCYPPRWLDTTTQALDAKAQSINRQVSLHPEVTFYSYFIKKDTDIDFSTGTKTGQSAYFMPTLDIPAAQRAVFTIDSFEEFSDQFFETDHHWNYKGSYRAYLQLLELLDIPDAPLTPLETVTLSTPFSGSKATTSGARDLFTEYFTAYRFDCPAYRLLIDGAPAEQYGSAPAFLDGTTEDTPSYSQFYGGDKGEIIFDTGNSEKEDILILGESYDNALLNLLASHFRRTYSVDLRYYESTFGTPFHFSDYLRTHQITKVLLIGNLDYYISDDFMLED